MKDLGYHQGYRYAHDYENAYTAQEYLPEKLQGAKYYQPRGEGYEKTINERMHHLKNIKRTER
jgi:putative ATPase